MTMTTYFSIIIPLYNKYDFIEKAVFSVLNQSYPHFELIVIDDGSSDGSIQVVENIKDTRIKLFKQSNGGVSSARNKGIEIAKYDLIALLDADDWWGDNYLESMLKLILKYPDVSIYGSRYGMVENKKIYPSKAFFNDSISDVSFDLLDLVVENKNFMLPLHSSSFVICKDILKITGGFDGRIKYFEDYDFFLRLSLHSKVAYLNTCPLAFYVQDVPSQNRATGKIPALKDHMVYYLDKFIPFYEINMNLKVYIDKFKLWSLLNYRYNNFLKDEVNRIKRDVSIKNYSWKYLILYHTPTILTSIL